MFRQEFPDYQWLKKQAESSFQDKKGVDNITLPNAGWPLVILNVKTTFCDRQNIKGPLSFFSNIKGHSYLSAGGKKVKVNQQSFFVSNHAQHYSLEIDNQEETEIFNFHLGHSYWEDFVLPFLLKEETLLDEPFDKLKNSFELPNTLFLKNEQLNNILQSLYQRLIAFKIEKLELEEKIYPLCVQLLKIREDLNQQIHGFSATKYSTRQEIFKRISLSTDYILSNPETNFSLEELSGVSCLSKFHFLRAFKQIYKITPHQFVLKVRLQKAQQLLKESPFTASEVGLMCGFDELSSFSRLFKKWMGVSPEKFRAMVK
jgi:AraC family transcriptional regulator